MVETMQKDGGLSDTAEILVTEEGQWLFDENTRPDFRNLVQNPLEYGARLIGDGSEGLVYQVQWAGVNCVLKVFNNEAQSQLDAFSKDFVYNPCFSRPNFLKRAGFLPQVMEVINDIPNIPFDIVGVKDYAFGRDFHFMEFIDNAIPLPELFSLEAEAFMTKYDISDAQLDVARSALVEVENAVSAVRETGWFRSRLVHDLAFSNVLVRGNLNGNRLNLVLIDQGVDVPYYLDPNAVLDEMYARLRYEAAEMWYEKKLRNSSYSTFIRKYMPAGFPKKKFYA